MPQQRTDRKYQILQALAGMLEQGAQVKITTARLAEEVGVSEAALYRHFPSKTKMFEALIEFAEETLFTRIKLISEEPLPALERCNRILFLLLGFCERNPGLTRVIHGEALAGEHERLHLRVVQLFERLETQLRTLLRQAELEEHQRPQLLVNDAAQLLLACAEGRISQFLRSKFKRLPTAGWEGQWQVLVAELMRPVPSADAV